MEKKKLIPKCLRDFVLEMNKAAGVEVNDELATTNKGLDAVVAPEKLEVKKGTEPIEVDAECKEQNEARERWVRKIVAEFESQCGAQDISGLSQGHVQLADNLMEQNLLWETAGKGVSVKCSEADCLSATIILAYTN